MSQDTDPDDDWRDAVRETMYEATLHEAHQRFDSREPIYNYRWEHVRVVYALAMKLARITGADEEIVEAAAWLHDVRKVAGVDHPEEGADFARRFLAQTNFPGRKIEAVAQAIAAHRGLWREDPLESLEAQVLWDADKLSKLGLTAAFHWTGMSFANGNPLTTEDLIAMARDSDWQEKTVDSMHIPAARRAAIKRLDAYNRLWDSLEAELEGRDLE